MHRAQHSIGGDILEDESGNKSTAANVKAGRHPPIGTGSVAETHYNTQRQAHRERASLHFRIGQVSLGQFLYDIRA